MKRSNPAVNKFMQAAKANMITGSSVMTINGTINKTLLLWLIMFGTGVLEFVICTTGNPIAYPAGIIGAIAGFGVAIYTNFSPTASPLTAPLYASLEGLIVGLITFALEKDYPGIAIEAAVLTGTIMGGMLVLYRAGILRATPMFTRIVVAATLGAVLFYGFAFIVSLFGMTPPLVWSSSPMGIGFTVLMAGIAAMNYILDFDLIEQGARYGVPKYMEWYGAFAITVTTVWLYIEMLRLLSKLRSR